MSLISGFFKYIDKQCILIENNDGNAIGPDDILIGITNMIGGGISAFMTKKY